MTRKLILAAALVGFTSAATASYAQSVIFEPEDEVVVREYIVKQPRTEYVIPDDYGVDDLEVGAIVPETITVTPLDAPGFERRFEYIVVDGRTVLIDPETRAIVKVLD